MENSTKNALLVVMGVVTVAALVFAFQTMEPKSDQSKTLTFEQATDIKSKVESLKTDKEKADYLSANFNVVKRQPLVSLNTSNAAADWCAYADYYEKKANEAGDGSDGKTVNEELFDAYNAAYVEMWFRCHASE